MWHVSIVRNTGQSVWHVWIKHWWLVCHWKNVLSYEFLSSRVVNQFTCSWIQQFYTDANGTTIGIRIWGSCGIVRTFAVCDITSPESVLSVTTKSVRNTRTEINIYGYSILELNVYEAWGFIKVCHVLTNGILYMVVQSLCYGKKSVYPGIQQSGLIPWKML